MMSAIPVMSARAAYITIVQHHGEACLFMMGYVKSTATTHAITTFPVFKYSVLIKVALFYLPPNSGTTNLWEPSMVCMYESYGLSILDCLQEWESSTNHHFTSIFVTLYYVGGRAYFSATEIEVQQNTQSYQEFNGIESVYYSWGLSCKHHGVLFMGPQL